MTPAPVEERPDHPERLDEAVRLRQGRRERWQREGERSIGQNLAMIGVLGWTIIVPTLLGLFLGRWLDHSLIIGANSPQVFFSATCLTVGVAIGFWSAWRWMHRRGP